MENPRNKSFISFQLYPILSSAVESHTVLLSHPGCESSHAMYTRTSCSLVTEQSSRLSDQLSQDQSAHVQGPRHPNTGE